MNPLPLGCKVLCRDVLTEETKPGGSIILLEDRRKEMASQQAEVIAVGSECEMGLQEGDWVLTKAFARSYLPDDTFLLLESDIVAKLEMT